MKILALDISKSKTGYCIYDSRSHYSSMIIGSFSSKGEDFLEAVSSYLPQLVALVKLHQPDYAVFEEGLSYIPTYTSRKTDIAGETEVTGGNAKSSLILQRLLGSTQAVLHGMKIPYESVDSQTWRKAFLGYGKKKGMDRKAYKKAARAMCETMGITVKNDDQAEAAGIAFWCAKVSQQFKMKRAA